MNKFKFWVLLIIQFIKIVVFYIFYEYIIKLATKDIIMILIIFVDFYVFIDLINKLAKIRIRFYSFKTDASNQCISVLLNDNSHIVSTCAV